MKYEELDIHLKRQAKILFKKFNISNRMNIGQTWGWEYDDIFVHFVHFFILLN